MFLFVNCYRILLIFGLCQILACDNLLDSVSTKDTPEALVFATQISIDKKEWTEALATIASMDTDTQITANVQRLKASAFAGRCGFEYVPWIQGLAEIGTDNLFLFLMKRFSGVTQAQMDDCISADLTFLGITTDSSLRSIGDNLVFAFLSLAKIGAILSFHADINADKIADPGFDSCSAAQLPDLYAKHVTTGFANALNAFTASASGIAGSLTGDLGSICTLLADPPFGASYDFCAIALAENVTADQLTAMRTLIYEPDALGLATCTAGPPTNVATCACP